uniref:Uncharacterized protein n=1 Tax=Micrurus carvalhoi TaxID=3147026 RepID=A0A2H6MUE8_9SAUR
MMFFLCLDLLFAFSLSLEDSLKNAVFFSRCHITCPKYSNFSFFYGFDNGPELTTHSNSLSLCALISATRPSFLSEADRIHHSFIPFCQDYKTWIGSINSVCHWQEQKKEKEKVELLKSNSPTCCQHWELLGGHLNSSADEVQIWGKVNVLIKDNDRVLKNKSRNICFS